MAGPTKIPTSTAVDLDEWITLDYADKVFEVDTNAIKTSAGTTAGATAFDINDGVGQTNATDCWQVLWDIKDVNGDDVDLYQSDTYSGIEFRFQPSGTLPTGDNTLLTIGLAKGEALLGNDFFLVGVRWETAGAPDVMYQVQTSESYSSQVSTDTGLLWGRCLIRSDAADLECSYQEGVWLDAPGGTAEAYKSIASSIDLGDDSDSDNSNRIVVCVAGSTGGVTATLQYRLLPFPAND